jgi:uncharacterized protein YjdB
MNTRTSAFRRLAILSLSALAFAACDNKEITPVAPLDPTVTITPSSATIPVGATTTFVGSVSGDTVGANSGVNYISTNTAVATVSSAGVVTAVAPGQSTIIASSKFRPSKQAAAQVTVTPVVSLVNVVVAPSSATLTPGQTVNLVASVTGTTNTSVTYASSDTSVAKVSTAGVVTATSKNGIAIVTATSVADPSRSASSTITVQGGNGPGTTVITITPSTATINVGESFTFASVVTGNANTAKTFTSSDTSVAKVNATTGVVTATNKAGTTTITATATGDVSKTASATLIVVRPTITVTAAPTTVTLSPGQTTTITSTITGGSAADQAAGVTCTVSAADQAVATVTSPGCVVTGVAAGQATVVVRSVADATKTALVTVNVAAVQQPSISISSVTTPGGLPIAPGAAVAGNIVVNLNVSAGSATSIQRVAVRLGGVEACSQTFNPPLAPTQGVAPITCVVNTAQLTPAGIAVFQNGTYLLTADAFSIANSVSPVATATYGNIILANVNTVNGTVTFDNSLSDSDNTPAATTAINGGVQWNGGSATVTVTPAVYTGTAVAKVDVNLDANCDGVPESTQTATIGANGQGSVTFSEAAAMGGATNGDDNTENANVCFYTNNGRAANTTAVNVGTVTVVAGQPVDNVPPTFVGVGALPPAVTTNNNYAGSNTSFTSATVVNGTATDAGVGGVTYSFFAVPAGTALASQSAFRTAVSGLTAITSASQLQSSTVSNAAYILVERATDALGNTIYANLGTFGVDLENPTIAVGPGSVAATGTINAAANDVVVAVTDTFSGPITLQFRGTISSVLEVDSDAGTEVRCITSSAGATAAVGGSGVCPLVTLTGGLTNIGGQTEIGTITVPQAAANNDEGYITLDVQGVDRAGNISSTTLSFTTLNDVTAPGANGQPNTLDIVTLNNTLGTVRLQGTINENVDLRSYDTRFTYTGIGGAVVPDQIPFVPTIGVDSYGLPLTGVVSVDQTSPVVVRDITDQAGANTQASNYGFFAEDIAGNNSFTSQGITAAAGAGLVASFQNGVATDFDASFGARADDGGTNTACLDRSGPSAGCTTSTTVFAQVRVAPTSANPVGTVFFYQVRPGGDATFGTADDYNVLLGSTSSATVVTGISDRTFTYSMPINNSMFPNTTAANPDVYPVFAIAVAPGANGSGVMSDILTLNAQD